MDIYSEITKRIQNWLSVLGTVNLYAQNSMQAVIEKSRYAMEESPRAASRCFMFMYFLLPH